MKNDDVINLLVDGSAGVYAYSSLAKRYPLFIDSHTGRHTDLAEHLKNDAYIGEESIESVFDPDNEFYCENIDWLTCNNTLCVKHDNGEYWRVESIDGDIFAVNPKASWNDDIDNYEIIS